MHEIRTKAPSATDNHTPVPRDSVNITQTPEQGATSVQLPKLPTLEAEKIALTPPETYETEANAFMGSVMNLRQYEEKNPSVLSDSLTRDNALSLDVETKKTSFLEKLPLKTPEDIQKIENISTPVYLVLQHEFERLEQFFKGAAPKSNDLHRTNMLCKNALEAKMKEIARKRKESKLPDIEAEQTIHKQKVLRANSEKLRVEAHANLKALHARAAESKLALDQESSWFFLSKHKLSKQAETDQQALIHAAINMKGASHLAYSVISNAMTDLESKWRKLAGKEESELTLPHDPENPLPDQHTLLIKQMLHLKNLQIGVENSEKASFEDKIESKWVQTNIRWFKAKIRAFFGPAKAKVSEKVGLLVQYQNLLNFKNIFEKRLVAAAKKQLDSDVKTVKTILDKPNSFGLARAKNLQDLNDKMRIAKAKIDKEYFYPGDPHTVSEAAKTKALNTEHTEVLALLIPPSPPKKVDLRSFDQMQKDAKDGLTDSDQDESLLKDK